MVSLLDESTFKKISEILIDEYADITKTKSVEDYIREYEERLNLGTKAAYEEFVADCMTNMLTDTNAAETIVKLRNTMNEKAQNKFIKLINDTIRTLKSFVKRSNAIETASITSQLKSLQKISDLWAQGVSNAMTEFEKTENKGKSVENDVKYSLKGINKDGIEVYETSPETMSLSWNELIKEYKRLLENDFKGRTARFNRNGHVYYAQFDEKSANKVLFGEKGMSAKGKKAIIKAGADGDIFDIVENATYESSSTDTKNHKNKDGFTEYFDYFYKTVQIDGNIFDLIINVKKQYGTKDGYTYTIKVFDNNKIEASPAFADKQQLWVQGTPQSNNIISTNTGKSQEKFSEKLTNIVDSDGKKLSEAQAEFFKDSKVRDEDGNLLKVYHGTNSDFTVFNRGEKNGQLGKGIYFAADKSYAKENGKKIVSAYLNVENPFTVTDNTNILTAINEKFPGTDYIEMTKVLAANGYDGIIYDHWDNGKIIVAFEPNQIKLTDNLTPTENEDVRFSDKLDTDYLKLASEPEKNEKELNKLVESAAMEWGAYSPDGKKPVRLYHGTDKFGFTKFDISKSDDRRTIFLTSSLEIASTYSQISGERKISERTDIDVDKLSMARTVELLNKYPEYSDFEYEYSYTNGNETKKKLNAELNKLNSLADKLMEKYKEEQYVSIDTEDYYDRLLRIKKLIFDKEQRNKYLSTQLYINLNNTDMFSGNENFINEVEQDIRLANILETKGNPNANYVVEKSMGGYSIELLSLDEAKDKLRESQKHGNYALYAKFDNPLVIDADGKNWNDIYAILEPSEKTTFKAEYDLKDNALVLSDEKGEFATLTVDGTLESVLPSMARAITNRYGKFFAATVFAQAKDK